MMSDVFDNIVISLCKFTALSAQHEVSLSLTFKDMFRRLWIFLFSKSIDQISVNFGMNNKAQLACKTVFQLTHNHGDILRDGWKNILDCIIQLYKAKLLPKVLIEVSFEYFPFYNYFISKVLNFSSAKIICIRKEGFYLLKKQLRRFKSKKKSLKFFSQNPQLT